MVELETLEMPETPTEVASPTSTSTEVASPTSTSTEAETTDNVTITVTGGAGEGDTAVVVNNANEEPPAENEIMALRRDFEELRIKSWSQETATNERLNGIESRLETLASERAEEPEPTTETTLTVAEVPLEEEGGHAKKKARKRHLFG